MCECVGRLVYDVKKERSAVTAGIRNTAGHIFDAFVQRREQKHTEYIKHMSKIKFKHMIIAILICCQCSAMLYNVLITKCQDEVKCNQLHGRVISESKKGKDISSFSGFFIFALAQQVTAKESELFKMEIGKETALLW